MCSLGKNYPQIVTPGNIIVSLSFIVKDWWDFRKMFVTFLL